MGSGQKGLEAMKVLYLTKYSKWGPSSRYRVYQYLDYFKKEGIKYTICPLFKGRYFKILFCLSGIRRLTQKIIYSSLRLGKRIIDLRYVIGHDLIVVEREIYPYLPPILEYFVKFLNKNLIVEFDDAIFLTLGHGYKLPRIIRLAKHVIVGNDYLKKYTLRYNKNVTIIPTAIDTEKYHIKERRRGKEVIIGWIGLPYNLSYLIWLERVFKILSKRYQIVLKVISARELKMEGVKVINRRWNLETEIDELQSLDIGIMPLPDSEWTRGKCGLKILQYMGVGIPVVASPVGVNSAIIQDGVNGFLASSEKEWIEKLSLLIEDEELCKKLGKRGREKVEKYYSLKVIAPRLKTILEKVYSGD